MRQGSIRASVAARLALLSIVVLLLGGSAHLRPQPGSVDLAEQARFSRFLPPDQPHHYHLRVPAGRAAVVTAFQLGQSDVRLEAVSPAGRVAMDHASARRGFERLTLIAGSRPILFLLEVRNAGGPEVSHYSIRTEGPRPVQPEDGPRARAERLWSDAFAERKKEDGRTFARDRFQRAADAWRSAGEPLDRGQALLELAELAQKDEDFDAMSRAAATALELFQRLPDQRHDLEMKALYLVGLGLAKISETDAALELYDQARALFHDQGLERHRDLWKVERIIREETGVAYWQLGQSLRARRLFEGLLEEDEAADLERARSLGWLGRTDMDAGNMDLARWRFDQVIELATQEGDEVRLSIGLLLLAKAWRRDEGVPTDTRNRKALDLLERSWDHASGADAEHRIDILNEEAKAWRQLGDDARAAAGYERALDLAVRSDSPRDQAIVLANRAVHELETGRLAAASKSLDEALALIRASAPPGLPAAALNQRSARLAFTAGDYDRALELALRAVALLDDAWTRSTDSSTRLRLGASRRSYFELLVDVYIALHQRHPDRGYDLRALLASDWGRARLLLEAMEHADLDLTEGAPPQLIADQSRAVTALRTVEAQLQTVEQASLFGLGVERLAIDDLEDRIETLRRTHRAKQAALQRLDDQLRRESPRFRALGLGPRLTAEQFPPLLASLPEGTGVLVFFLGDQRSHGWLIDDTGMTYRPLRPRAEIESVAQALYGLHTKGDDPILRPQIESLARDLSARVLEPFAGVLGSRSLVVVPDGALLRVSWSSLPKPGDARARPMLEHHELVSVQSLEVLSTLLTSTDARRRDATLAVLGDPVFSDLDPRVSRPRQRPDPIRRPRGLYADTLERLEYAGTEALEILSLVEPEQSFAALGFDATRDLVLTGRLSHHDIIHIATHGIVDSETTPYLALTQIDRDGRALDGRLTTRDIAQLDLATRLVVLSACESGVGREVDGEGLFSLSRAFMAAGAPRMVASLWQVDDKVTADLMELFYRGLLVEDLSPARALQSAQIEIMSRPGSSTQDWAAWTLIGSPTW